MSVEINQQLSLLNQKLNEQDNRITELEALLYKVIVFVRNDGPGPGCGARFDQMLIPQGSGITAEELVKKVMESQG